MICDRRNTASEREGLPNGVRPARELEVAELKMLRF